MASLVCQYLRCVKLKLYVLNENELKRFSEISYQITSWSKVIKQDMTQVYEYDIKPQVV